MANSLGIRRDQWPQRRLDLFQGGLLYLFGWLSLVLVLSLVVFVFLAPQFDWPYVVCLVASGVFGTLAYVPAVLSVGMVLSSKALTLGRWPQRFCILVGAWVGAALFLGAVALLVLFFAQPEIRPDL